MEPRAHCLCNTTSEESDFSPDTLVRHFTSERGEREEEKNKESDPRACRCVIRVGISSLSVFIFSKIMHYIKITKGT